MHHINSNKRKIGQENGTLFSTDDPNQFVRVYTVQEVLDLNRLQSDFSALEPEYLEKKALLESLK